MESKNAHKMDIRGLPLREGMVPVKSLAYSFNLRSCDSRIISGMVPVRSLLNRERYSSLESPLDAFKAGMVPVNLL